MGIKFQQVVNHAVALYLEDQNQPALTQQSPQQPQPSQGAPQQSPPDAAMPQPDAAQSQAGYDTYRNLTIQLLRIVGQFANAIQSNDEEQLSAVQRTIPEDLSSDIDQTIGQITTAEPAKVATIVSSIVSKISPTSSEG